MSQDIMGECEGGVQLNSILLYIVEGFVPLLSAFCMQLGYHISAGPVYSGLTPQVINVLATVGSNFAVSCIPTHRFRHTNISF